MDKKMSVMYDKKEADMYDTSSAGHIQAGDDPLESAQRELYEELGIKANEGNLSFTCFCLMWTVCDMQRASCLCAF